MVILALAVLIGLLWSAAIYLLLRKHFMRVILGLMLLGHSLNLFVFTVASLPGLKRGVPPLIPEGGVLNATPADPLPQVMILTAIVINLGIFAFAVVLFRRWHQMTDSDDLDELRLDR